MECRLHPPAVLARVCCCYQNFAAVDEVLSRKALKTESYVPEKVGSDRRFELSEAPARYAERPVLFDELSQAGLMRPGHDLDLGALKSAALQHG